MLEIGRVLSSNMGEVPETEYTLFCDESLDRGPYFSNFYGGVLVNSKNLAAINDRIASVREEHEVSSDTELEWKKVSQHRFDAYSAVIAEVFALIREGKLKARIMFRANCDVPINLGKEQKDRRYFLLYYQFLKNGFGLASRPRTPGATHLRMVLDRLPEKIESKRDFKKFLRDMCLSQDMLSAQISIPEDGISEKVGVHYLSDAADILAGAAQFRLNCNHLCSEAGKKTEIKISLCTQIDAEIRKEWPYFDHSTNTPLPNTHSSAPWEKKYGHWRFVPSQSRFDGSWGWPGNSSWPT
jgi:hypothetical protein